jgi:hypothetical protein
MKIKSIRFSPARLAMSFLSLALLSACSAVKPATNITGSWKDPETTTTYKDFMIVVLSKNLPVRSTFEGDISRKLKAEDVKASKSLDIIPHTEKVETIEDKKAAVEKIQSLGHDAIITVTLVKQTEENRYIPGQTQYQPTTIGVGTGYYNPVTRESQGGGNYGAFGVYYMAASKAYSTDGYYTVDKNYFVQTNMFDTKTAKLVWSAQSETFNPGDLSKASGDFSYVMVEALKKSGLLYKKK